MTGRPRRPWLLTLDDARRLYESGETLAGVARACGLSSSLPVRQQFREAGVSIRERGPEVGRPSSRVSLKKARICAGAHCVNTFESYPSSNKRYCSPACRYADPELAKLLSKSIERKHQLSEIDAEQRRAVCSNCGPTHIRERREKGKFADRPRWRCRSAEKARDWARQYGVTAEDIFALRDAQDGLCAICGVLFEDDFHVDHDHDSGRVRGLLCSNCNTGLGLFGEDVERMRQAIKYLEAHAAWPWEV